MEAAAAAAPVSAAARRRLWRRWRPPAGAASARYLFPALLVVACALSAVAQAPGDDGIPDVITEQWITKYLKEEYEPQVTSQCNKLNLAEWEYETNIKKETEDALQEATLEYAAFEKEKWEKVFGRVNYEDFKDPYVIRQLDSLSILGIPVLDVADLEELSTCTTNMTSTYSTAKICPYKKPNCQDAEKLSLDPGIEEIIFSSRDYDELAYVWKSWRDASGKLMRENYNKYVELNNKAAKINKFKDMGEMWRHHFDSDSLKDEMLTLWKTIEPLYTELHKFVRTKLKKHYGDKLDISDDLLPAHVLGNMWAQRWINIFDLVKPYPESSAVNVTQKLISDGYDALKMFTTSNDFYKSLGLEDDSMSYGKDAMLTRPEDKEVVCHASAWDFCNGKDFRIKMCTKINMEDFVTIHHEMGHIQYFIQYKEQPYAFRKGANPGFHEAIGDTIALSVSTPNHLKKVGLLESSYPDSDEDNINSLMSMALEKVAFLPFGLLIDMWRWDVFSGEVSSDRWNEHWWDLRKNIQRIKPPVPRSEDDFDPGAKFHVPGDSQYISYFIAHVLQFQFHRALCIAAGQYIPNDNNSQPLHKCDIFESREAGDRLKRGLKLGGSTHWKDALEAITGERDYSGEALLEYFQPLYDYLVAENSKERNENSQILHRSESSDQTIPIVVGCVLGGLLICVLIGYVIFRRRTAARRRAEIPSTPGSNISP